MKTMKGTVLTIVLLVVLVGLSKAETRPVKAFLFKVQKARIVGGFEILPPPIVYADCNIHNKDSSVFFTIGKWSFRVPKEESDIATVNLSGKKDRYRCRIQFELQKTDKLLFPVEIMYTNKKVTCNGRRFKFLFREEINRLPKELYRFLLVLYTPALPKGILKEGRHTFRKLKRPTLPKSIARLAPDDGYLLLVTTPRWITFSLEPLFREVENPRRTD